MFLLFEQVASDGSVKTVTALNPPATATHVEIVADTQDVRYTMDGTTNPAASSGMLFKTADPPKPFSIDDLKRIRFTQGGGGAGKLNLHYLKG